MNNPFVMVVLIVLVVMVASVMRSILGTRRDRKRDHGPIRDDGETRALRDEVKPLKERLAVLERITVEKENSLEREIERLRDRQALTGGAAMSDAMIDPAARPAGRARPVASASPASLGLGGLAPAAPDRARPAATRPSAPRARFELADLRDRVRRLEAIANGVERSSRQERPIPAFGKPEKADGSPLIARAPWPSTSLDRRL